MRLLEQTRAFIAIFGLEQLFPTTTILSILSFRSDDQTIKAARVIGCFRHTYLLRFENNQECLAEVTGKLLYQAAGATDLPVIGDWVIAVPRFEEGTATITSILARQSKLSRLVHVSDRNQGSSGTEQPLASNVDVVFIVSSLNQDLNLRRLERYLMMVAESGARPVIILTKSDLCEDTEEYIDLVRSVAFSTPIHALSVLTQ